VEEIRRFARGRTDRSGGPGYRVLALALLVALPGGALDAQQPPVRVDVDAVVASLEPEIRRAMIEGRIPSMTVALVAGERLVWSAGFGESNLRARTPATPSTVYLIGSTFKTMATAALLQLHEEGRFELDDPIRDHMGGLTIADEDPDDPVTFRHLLTHTSGLPTVFSSVPVWADTVPMPMDRYLAEQLRVMGPPMERIRYSNMAYTLLGHLVQEISGTEFREFVRTRIFEPAGMGSTDFAPTPGMMERISVPYVPDPSSGALVPVARVRFSEWPAGQVWGTVLDQAAWLIVNLDGVVDHGPGRGTLLRPLREPGRVHRLSPREPGPASGDRHPHQRSPGPSAPGPPLVPGHRPHGATRRRGGSLNHPVPRVSLGTFPTPVERLSVPGAAQEVWVKRDDRSGQSYGGNKIRKLEFLLADARARGAGRSSLPGPWAPTMPWPPRSTGGSWDSRYPWFSLPRSPPTTSGRCFSPTTPWGPTSAWSVAWSSSPGASSGSGCGTGGSGPTWCPPADRMPWEPWDTSTRHWSS
jgi:CubicO group peptidase (beta-lactamase class C family)